MSNDMRSLLDLMEAQAIKGNLDVRGMLKLLPEVDNQTQFMTGFNKLKQGREDSLTRQEMTQFANAFISLIKEPKEDKLAILRKLSMVSDPTAQKGV